MDNKQRTIRNVRTPEIKRKAARTKKERKQHPVLKKVGSVLFVIISIAVICGTVAGVYVYNYADEYINGKKQIDLEYYKANQEQTSIIYAYDANKELVELISLHGAENREWIDYKEIPQDMIDAFRDLEDKRFNEHNGVDWYGTVFGVVKSGFGRGASTITQQLIKNITDQNSRTVNRKFHEILNALNVERYYNKKTIMEFYLNTIYLGNGCYGIKTAAEKYFGKDVADLSIEECAIIASITQEPGTYNPLKHPDAVKTRQEYCLKCMLENESITQKEYDKAIKAELIYTNSKNYKGSQVTEDKKKDDNNYTEDDVKFTNLYDGKSSYYVEYVIDDVIEDLQKEYELTYNEAWRKVFFGGLRIYAAVDLEAQKAAENVYLNRETFPNEKNTEERPAAQSAITIMDYSGRVVAMVGGAGEKGTFRGLNRATQSPRQPGSSIKPISVYAPAIENKVATWSTMVQNYGIRRGSGRYPTNFGGNPGSPTSFVTVQYALQQSYNTVPAQIGNKMGFTTCVNFLHDKLNMQHLDMNTNSGTYDGNASSMAVGGTTYGMTTLEMAAAFAIFGNNGYYYEPYSYYKVTNHDGSETLLKSSDNDGEQVIAESTSGVMRRLLQTVVTSGTGSAYGINGFTTFGKTGTTSDDHDRWFVGGTPYYVAAVWYGYDKPRPITNVSGNPAGKLFKRVLNDIHEDYDDLSFPASSGVVSRRYCRASGCIATEECGSTAVGYYRSNKIPARCKGCAITGAIGQGVPSVIPATTEEESSTEENSSTTLGSTKPTKPVSNKTSTTKDTTAPTTKSTTTVITTAPVTTLPPSTTEPVSIQEQAQAVITNSFIN